MTTPSKPTVLSPRFDDVPLELQAIPHWVIWKLEYVVQDERWTKPPYDRKGVKTNPTNPASWSTFDDVVAAYDGDKRFDGVGFALDGTDDIVGIDLDDLKDHLYQSEVHAVYEALLHSGTYIEQSPSGTGLRAFLHGRLPFRGKRNATLGIEVYGTKRYLTVTGHRIQTAGQEIVDDQRCIDAIVAVAFPAKKPVNVDLTGAATDPVPTFLRDDEVQRRARNARNGEHFFLLWDGRWQEYYELRGKQVASQSEADLALCSMLAFWTAKNAAQIDRLFRQSRLMRAKWDEQHGETTYGQRTIATAIAGCTDVYMPAVPSEPSLRVVPLSGVTPTTLEWLWPNFLPLGKVSLIAGNPGLGKSQITLDIAARVSAGTSLPTGEPATRGRVILICGEDDVADTIVPRLIAAGADLSQIDQVASVIERDEKGEPRDRGVSLQQDLVRLEELLAKRPDVRLVVVDPISAYLGNVDSHNNAETRGLLEPLSRMAQQFRVAVVVVSHLNKGTGPAIYRTTGSIAFVAAARAAFIVVQDETNASVRYFLPTKTNLSKDSVGIGYEIQLGANNAPHVAWKTTTVTGADLDSLLDVTPADERPRLREAMDWLSAKLATGPVPSSLIQRDAKKEGVALRTLDRAKAKLKVEAKRMGLGWCWIAPSRSTGMRPTTLSPSLVAAATPNPTVIPTRAVATPTVPANAPFVPRLGPPPAWVANFSEANL